MKKHFILFLFFLFLSKVYSQNNNISMSAGYANQVFYSMQEGETQNINNGDWDLAFSIGNYSSSIRINDGMGVELYNYHLGDTSDWNNINQNIINMLSSPLNNSDTSWMIGGFDINSVPGGFDFGWGVYNIVNHHVVGDSLFIIKTINGNWKKLWIQNLASGEYNFKYSNIDGSNEFVTSLKKSDFQDKLFGYYSIDQNNTIDREPLSADWDITFTKYITSVQGMPYSVTGVLSNINVKVAEANNVTPATYYNFNNHIFQNEINTIGYDWKTFDMSSFSYILNPNVCFFIKDQEENIWRLYFNSFEGSSTGNVSFNTELISTAAVEEGNQNNNITIYPNPASDYVNLICESSKKDNIIYISDINGKIVLKEKTTNCFSAINVNVSNFKKGIYIVSLVSDNFIKKEKLIIK
mgnify:FL=1